MKIGNIELKNRYVLAPMAGVSDLPFRLLCSEYGAALVCTEMVSAKALHYHNKNTVELMQTRPEERPVSLLSRTSWQSRLKQLRISLSISLI